MHFHNQQSQGDESEEEEERQNFTVDAEDTDSEDEQEAVVEEERMRQEEEEDMKHFEPVQKVEIRSWIAIILAMCLVGMPSLEDYWKDPTTDGGLFGNVFIKSRMSRKRCGIGSPRQQKGNSRTNCDSSLGCYIYETSQEMDDH